jgi:hypothetical protein
VSYKTYAKTLAKRFAQGLVSNALINRNKRQREAYVDLSKLGDYYGDIDNVSGHGGYRVRRKRRVRARPRHRRMFVSRFVRSAGSQLGRHLARSYLQE